MEHEKISIIIPAYNEAGAVGDVVRALITKFPTTEVIVVNDGSTDGTGALAEAAGARVINRPEQGGYGASLRVGILATKREYVLFCDADGQHQAESVGTVIDACQPGIDMVVGSRSKDSHMPLIRRPGKAILRYLINYLAGKKIPDFNSGLRIIRRTVILRYLHLMPEGFSFSTTSTFALLKSRYHIQWVPITTAKRIGKSQVRQLKHGSQTILLILRLTVLFEPLKVFLRVSGILFFFFCLSIGVDILLLEKQMGSYPT
jgi:glycosyltransferase involved in cell wall biosynthesis